MSIPYHDAQLTGIQIRDDGDIVLSIRSTKGDSYECLLRGIHHFCCNNFREGNTVLGRREQETAEIMERDLRTLLYAQAHESPKKLTAMQQAISQGDLVFYKLIGSYGATVLAVCNSVSEISRGSLVR